MFTTIAITVVITLFIYWAIGCFVCYVLENDSLMVLHNAGLLGVIFEFVILPVINKNK